MHTFARASEDNPVGADRQRRRSFTPLPQRSFYESRH